jgi:hypothetical protein
MFPQLEVIGYAPADIRATRMMNRNPEGKLKWDLIFTKLEPYKELV